MACIAYNAQLREDSSRSGIQDGLRRVLIRHSPSRFLVHISVSSRGLPLFSSLLFDANFLRNLSAPDLGKVVLGENSRLRDVSGFL